MHFSLSLHRYMDLKFFITTLNSAWPLENDRSRESARDRPCGWQTYNARTCPHNNITGAHTAHTLWWTRANARKITFLFIWPVWSSIRPAPPSSSKLNYQLFHRKFPKLLNAESVIDKVISMRGTWGTLIETGRVALLYAQMRWCRQKKNNIKMRIVKKKREKTAFLTCPEKVSMSSRSWRRSCDNLPTVHTTTASDGCTSCSARNKTGCIPQGRLVSIHTDCQGWTDLRTVKKNEYEKRIRNCLW